MSKRLAFIHKDSLELIDHCEYPVIGGVTPMQDFYAVIIEAPRPIPTKEEIENELDDLRKLHPDTKTVFEGATIINYGKYSYEGLCDEPFEII